MRRLVVCADGTWNTKNQEDEGKLAPTNVVKMYEAVQRRPVASDGTEQVAFYHAGVGVEPNVLERALAQLLRLFGRRRVNRNLFNGATGEGIERSIKDCYLWLMHEYAPGDEIFLFGFSRGAYTVRSLAGFIRNSGLLPKHNEDLLDQAFELYRDRSSDTHPNSERARDFRRLYSRGVDIACLGVWDTVGTLGIPLGVFAPLNAERYQFHDVTLSSHVRHAYHALAIDEQRKPFAPTLWEQQPRAAQVLEQVWFVGVHSNIGGGYADCALSDITFLWMAERAGRASLDLSRTNGLELDASYVADVIRNAGWDGLLRDSMCPPYDALGPYVRPIAGGRSAADDSAGKVDERRERVHATAFQRFDQMVPPARVPYRPANLVDYLARFPRAAAGTAAIRLTIPSNHPSPGSVPARRP